MPKSNVAWHSGLFGRFVVLAFRLAPVPRLKALSMFVWGSFCYGWAVWVDVAIGRKKSSTPKTKHPPRFLWKGVGDLLVCCESDLALLFYSIQTTQPRKTIKSIKPQQTRYIQSKEVQ